VRWRLPSLRRRHAAHFLRHASRAALDYDSSYRRASGARILQRDWPDVSAALDYAKIHLRPLYAETVWDCRHYLAATRSPAEWLQFLLPAVSRRLRFRDSALRLHANLLIQVAHAYVELDDIETARRFANGALRLGARLHNDALVDAAHDELFHIATQLGDFESHLKAALKDVEAARSKNRPWLIAAALERLTEKLLLVQRYGEAIPYLHERLAIMRTTEHSLSVLALIEHIAMAHYRVQEFDAAIAAAKEILVLNQVYKWGHYDGWAHAYLVLASARLGDERSATISYERRLASLCGVAWSTHRLEDLANESIEWSNCS